MVETSEQLVERAVAEFEAPLIGYAMTIVHDRDRARDVVQDTFIRLNRQNVEKVNKGLKTWLFTVCRNRAFDILRKEKRMTPLEDEKLASTPSEASGPDRSVDWGERHAQLNTYIGRLTDNQQEVIRLKFQQGLSYKEISDITGLTTGNVGFLLHAGLKRLRELLPADLIS